MFPAHQEYPTTPRPWMAQRLISLVARAPDRALDLRHQLELGQPGAQDPGQGRVPGSGYLRGASAYLQFSIVLHHPLGENERAHICQIPIGERLRYAQVEVSWHHVLFHSQRAAGGALRRQRGYDLTEPAGRANVLYRCFLAGVLQPASHEERCLLGAHQERGRTRGPGIVEHVPGMGQQGRVDVSVGYALA
jgi:hypothetical protein